MDEFAINNCTGPGSLTFLDREPYDSSSGLDYFSVRLVVENLTASARVYASDAHPAPLFTQMARQWSGWTGELTWYSFEGDFGIQCIHDRLGHIAIRVELRSGFLDEDWSVVATVTTEAGQLERHAREAQRFFGSG
jgi:Family of unknown function (DUF6228)